MARRGIWILGGFLGLSVAAAGVVWATWPEPPPPTDWSNEYNTAPKQTETTSTPASTFDFPVTYELVSRPADSIPPGTVVDRSAPGGWSHLVIKSLPHIREDQKKDLPGLVISNASWMFTAFVADVKKETIDGKTRHRFHKAALGLGAKAKGKDTILTPETGRKLGGDMGLFGSEILSKGYEVQRKAVLVFSGPSMGLLDTPVWFRCGEDNRLIRYRYALLVDAGTGRLDVLLWRLGTEGGGCSGLPEAILVKPDTIDPAELVVDRRKVNRFGVPGDDAFAVDKMPAGRAVPIAAELKTLAAQTRFTADEAHALDTGLRNLLK
jgi:hypothetical protein